MYTCRLDGNRKLFTKEMKKKKTELNLYIQKKNPQFTNTAHSIQCKGINLVKTNCPVKIVAEQKRRPLDDRTECINNHNIFSNNITTTNNNDNEGIEYKNAQIQSGIGETT